MCEREKLYKTPVMKGITHTHTHTLSLSLSLSLSLFFFFFFPFLSFFFLFVSFPFSPHALSPSPSFHRGKNRRITPRAMKGTPYLPRLRQRRQCQKRSGVDYVGRARFGISVDTFFPSLSSGIKKKNPPKSWRDGVKLPLQYSG